MNKAAVIYLSPWGKVTGSLIDSLEYLIALKRSGVPVQLVYMGWNQGLPEKLIRDRYALEFDPLEDAIFLPLRWQVVAQKFDRVLLPYNTYRRIFWWLRARETFVLPSMWMRRDARWPFGFPVERGKVTYLLNPKQHDYRLRNVVPYEKKLLLDCLKQPATTENNLLINCQSSHKQHSAEEIHKAAKDIPHDKLLVLCGKRQAAYYRNAGFTVLTPPVEDFFARFSRYLYLPAIDGYDENPRLLIECAAMGKEIHFPEESCTDPHTLGKYQRLKESTQSFQIKADDFVLQQFKA
ncbi:hypothetical protein G0Q06_07250 [Puniceicoccales bacterium CK1056]|uniref:Glycosyltransferase family 1 protein n=1 Tax=Oceanipulchritudo coccoides TaxID=2706888 RepID=A0A6B2M206_9BACT|nr:hypothetical protein [Oceanipulchritudo coccoides]NDV62239.1 hypothetical protein [Oceanipulchritudo coccoides]